MQITGAWVTNDDEGSNFGRDEGEENVWAEQDVGVAVANSGEVDAQNRDQQGAWATSDNSTTIRCREASNGMALRSGRATMARLCSTAAAKRRNGEQALNWGFGTMPVSSTSVAAAASHSEANREHEASMQRGKWWVRVEGEEGCGANWARAAALRFIGLGRE
jgi:hypothetical protein